jgi:formate dehydrogenase major subunit
MAENHPVGFQWVMEARERGATLIHVDPRFTRTSAMADIHVPIRPGSDIAWLGGLIRYVLEKEAYFKEYVVAFTNAPVILREDFRDTEDLDGLFSGWSAKDGEYQVDSWQYEGAGTVPAAGHKHLPAGSTAGADAPDKRPATLQQRDETLQHPRCVFQVLRRHFSRYTPEIVEQICGVPRSLFEKVAEALIRNSGRERTSAFCYAVGWTHHSVGVQYIRTAAILQLLLGNIGRPGGGIIALRGHASIQGSTDIPTLFNIFPGYLPMPTTAHGATLDRYIQGNTSPTGWWSEFPKYIVSLLKAWFGDAATKQNDYLWAALPRLTGDHSHLTTVVDMADGKVPGYFVMGENPAVGSPNAALQRKGLRNAKWVVVRDLAMIETAEFWKSAPEVQSGEVRPEDIPTEVFFFPAAAHTEKEGTFTNTQRLLQWREKAVEPPGDARSELHFVFHLGRRLIEKARASGTERDLLLRSLVWDYPTNGEVEEPSAEAVLTEINGYTWPERKPVKGYTELKNDGTTACGCWIYSGCFAGGVNQTARRRPGREQSWVAPEWGWAWPANRRTLYNRASADLEGRPWSERKRLVWWDAATRTWTGEDVPDIIADRDPSYRAPPGVEGLASIGGNTAFLMQSDGLGWIHAPTGLIDGPLPTHYEPPESVAKNALYGQQCNPARLEYPRRDNLYHRAWDDPTYPFVLTTFRLTEHHTAGGMSRWLWWLSELQPQMFVEISPELARLRGIEHGAWATVSTARGSIEARALVTRRLRPLEVRGKTVHTIGVPWHWGSVGRTTGGSANELLAFVADPNVSIMESKALTADIRPGRVEAARRGPALPLESDPRRDLPQVGQHEMPSQEPLR